MMAAAATVCGEYMPDKVLQWLKIKPMVLAVVSLWSVLQWWCYNAVKMAINKGNMIQQC